jgi:hypothetical protein
MRAQAIKLDKTAAVEQDVEALARQQFALLVLAPGALFAAARFRFLIELAQLVEVVDLRHGRNILGCGIEVIRRKESVNHSKSACPVNQICADETAGAAESCAAPWRGLLFSLQTDNFPERKNHVRIET